LTLGFLFLTSLLVPQAASAAIPSNQRAALVEFYRATGGDQWDVNVRRTWLKAPGTECSWAGVHCDVTGSTVTELVLSGGNLTGQIPEAIGALRDLTALNLDYGQLGGALPHSIRRLSKLRFLRVASHRLIAIPPEIGELKSLELLALNGNRIRKLPPELGKLTNVTYVDLSQNRLRGGIPATFGGLQKMTLLTLDDNFLSGPIPAELGQCRALVRLFAERNQLSGPLPAELADPPQLSQLFLSDNQITEIPAAFGHAARLTELRLAGNRIASLPPELASAPNLRYLDLSFNQIAEIPDGFGSAAYLYTLSLAGNAIAEVPGDLMTHRFEVLDLSHNQIGALPIETGSFAGSLLDLTDNLLAELPAFQANANVYELHFAQNRLTAVPAGLENLPHLILLDLSRNQISGEMPAVLAGLQTLRSLDLSGNPFTPGPVPDWMRQLKVTELRLRSTFRTGEIPGWLRARSIERLDLGQNAFTPGPIPPFLAIFPGLRELRLDGTQRTGIIPGWLGERMFLDTLVLSDNAFDPGPVPDLVADSSLLFLDLGNTHRTGPLPAVLAQHSPRLMVLRLDRNTLTGPIPEAWAALRELRTLHLESNRLSGTLPHWIMDFAHLGELPSAIVAWMHHNDEGVGIDLRWNALVTEDSEVMAFVRSRQVDGADFLAFQTMPPEGLTAALKAPDTVLLTWSPAGISAEMGFYRVFSAPSATGPFRLIGQTNAGSVSFEAGMKPGMLKCFLLRAVTPPHAHNANWLVSPPTSPVCVAK
jgi:Leucine-rich repeat (LRR) protein